MPSKNGLRSDHVQQNRLSARRTPRGFSRDRCQIPSSSFVNGGIDFFTDAPDAPGAGPPSLRHDVGRRPEGYIAAGTIAARVVA